MPAFAEESDALAIKVGNPRDDNREKGLPFITAQVFLYDSDTGLPLALMDGTSITGLRTGAVGGLAAKYLARPDSEVMGIIGGGVQGRTNLMALNEIFDIKKVYIAEKVDAVRDLYIKEMSAQLGLDIQAASVEEATRNSDILVAVTGTTVPLVKDEWVHPGMHINAIGSDEPDKQECGTEVMKRARVFVDWMAQCEGKGDISKGLESGDLSKGDIAGELGQVIIGEVEGRQSDDQITFYDSTGIAFQDAVSAKMIYQVALDKGLGKKACL
jgi:alanine dehydrogenase